MDRGCAVRGLRKVFAASSLLICGTHSPFAISLLLLNFSNMTSVCLDNVVSPTYAAGLLGFEEANAEDQRTWDFLLVCTSSRPSYPPSLIAFEGSHKTGHERCTQA